MAQEYIEIHPVYRNQQEEMKSICIGSGKPASEFLYEGEPITLKTDTILQVRDESVPDGSANLNRFVMSLTDHSEDIIVRKEEGDRIRKQLIRNNNPVANELASLTNVIRNIYELIRARMH